MKRWYLLFLVIQVSSAYAQSVLFDFDNAPIYTSLPLDQTAGGITAHLSAPSSGYSIQQADVLGFTPPGFAGHIIYPNSIYMTDLYISFDQMLTKFSIMYCCQELGCDDAATMRVTAYKSGTYVGTTTKTAANPGTWPVDSLKCSFPQGFDSVVIHYDSAPPTCQDYGVIYLADNMRVTASTATEVTNPSPFSEVIILQNPASHSSDITFSLTQSANIHASVYNITGQLICDLFEGELQAGDHQLQWNAGSDAIAGGLYFLKLSDEKFSSAFKMVVAK
ncbi:MAG: T9SS type A sorting domain-containing protein [Chitinophagales bacterium]|nr:T9SS type A sorting domain-containing protein [Chitinophagales bacterium]